MEHMMGYIHHHHQKIFTKFQLMEDVVHPTTTLDVLGLRVVRNGAGVGENKEKKVLGA